MVVGLDPDRAYPRFARARFRHPCRTLIEGSASGDVPSDPFDVVVLSNKHVDYRVELLRELRERTNATRFLIFVPMENHGWLVPLRREP